MQDDSSKKGSKRRASRRSSSLAIERLTNASQEHLLQYYDQLSITSRHSLLSTASRFDFQELSVFFQKAVKLSQSRTQELAHAVPISESDYDSYAKCTNFKLHNYRSTGLQTISNGKVCALFVNNVSTPKGLHGTLYPGLPSKKCIFQLHADRLTRLETLAKNATGKECSIAWYIVGDNASIKSYRQFFKTHDFFGRTHFDTIFIEQNMLPCFNFKGCATLKDKESLFLENDGSGGVFEAIRKNGILNDMLQRNVEYIFTYSSENILVKICDPIFIGYCIEKNADCGSKIVRKCHAHEKIATVCSLKGKVVVVPSCDAVPEMMNLRKDNSIVFDLGNINNHLVKYQFFEQIVLEHEKKLPYHIFKTQYTLENDSDLAAKYTKGQDCLVLKKYFHDIFGLTDKLALWEVQRKSDYSLFYSDTGTKMVVHLDPLFKLHASYIKAAGGFVLGNEIEISPLVSYEGEGLDGVAGVVFHTPYHVEGDEDRKRNLRACSKLEQGCSVKQESHGSSPTPSKSTGTKPKKDFGNR